MIVYNVHLAESDLFLSRCNAAYTVPKIIEITVSNPIACHGWSICNWICLVSPAVHTVPKNNLKLLIKTEPVTVGAYATEYVWFLPLQCCTHCPKNNLNLRIKSNCLSRLEHMQRLMSDFSRCTHCPKNNVKLLIKTEPVTVGAYAREYIWFLPLHTLSQQ